MSITKNQFKLLTSLKQKKYRLKHKLFIAEGTKVVDEILNSDFELDQLFCVDDTAYKNIENCYVISEAILKKISTLKTPNNVVAIFKIPQEKPLINEGLILALDGINDPGNLGTIIRLCDWFGIEQIICSETTVDCYNTKVVQATMGSLTRVSIIYTMLDSYLKASKLPIYASIMSGKSMYESTLPKDGILIMGNEANGISKSVIKLANHTIAIPRFGNMQQTESLNVATATAILLSEFRRVV